MDENQSCRRKFLESQPQLCVATLVTPTVSVADVPAEEEVFKIAVGHYLQANFNNE